MVKYVIEAHFKAHIRYLSPAFTTVGRMQIAALDFYGF